MGKTTQIILLSITSFLFVPIPAFAGPVPDTGQTKCYGYQDDEIACPPPGEPFHGQDAHYTINPPSYAKLDANGNILLDSATSWVMVRDNVTGLIWEVKTADGSIHNKQKRYTWCDSNPETNGGYAGTPGDGTDTEDFINALNSANFGGFSDWRLPDREELRSIVNYGQYSPAIDTNYFPNTISSMGTYYWSSTTDASYVYHAWFLEFYSGGDGTNRKGWTYQVYVRAVRGGQSGPKDIITGDINDDGNVNLTDAILALQMLAGLETTSTIYKQSDGNGDGKIGLQEAIYILQKVSELGQESTPQHLVLTNDVVAF